MKKFKVAIMGRPNVGKSALVNRLCENDEAIVHERRGVTRDRTFHPCEWRGVIFDLIDTGGLEMSDSDHFKGEIRESALIGAEEADVIVFVVDGQVGIQNDDEDVAKLIRKTKKPVFLVVNKMDTPGDEDAIWNFMSLGVGEPLAISAVHGHGTGDLLDMIVDEFKKIETTEESLEPKTFDINSDDGVISIAIIGRPNAGKSTLTNKLTEQNRSIVSDVAGTTRDSIDTIVEHNGVTYRIIDTAGLRRKAKIDDDVEYYSYVRAMRAIDEADVAVLVVDGTLGITNEDQRVANYAQEKSCAMCIALNKWDAVEGADNKKEVRADLEEFMQFASYAPVQSISALTGKKVDKIWDAIDEAYANYTKKISTAKLNEWLAEIRESGHTISSGKTILRMKYVSQIGEKPPTFQIFCNRPDVVTSNYKRFLENKLRSSFDLKGTPVKIFMRGNK